MDFPLRLRHRLPPQQGKKGRGSQAQGNRKGKAETARTHETQRKTGEGKGRQNQRRNHIAQPGRVAAQWRRKRRIPAQKAVTQLERIESKAYAIGGLVVLPLPLPQTWQGQRVKRKGVGLADTAQTNRQVQSEGRRNSEGVHRLTKFRPNKAKK